MEVDTATGQMAPSSFKLLISIIRGSLPMIFVQCALQLVIILTVMRLGRESAEWLAGASLGALVYNICGLMLAMAPSLAMESVAPQAWGAGQPAEVGLAAQRSVVVAFLFLTPAASLWMFASPVLQALGQPSGVAELAAAFLQAAVASLPASVVFEATRKFLYSQAVSAPPLYAAAAGLLLLPLYQELLVGAFGFVGGPLAMVATQATMCAVLLAFCATRQPHAPETWPGVQPRLLLRERRAAQRFLGLSFAALLSLSEWLFWEFVTFRVGWFGSLALAVHGTAYSLLPLLYMVPMGLTIGLTNGVGQKLGAGAVGDAKRLAALTMSLGLGVIGALSLVTYLCRFAVFGMYTSDEDVAEGADAIWPWLCLDLMFDNSFAMLSGLNRGLGLQRRSALCIVLCLWPLGVPLIVFGAHSVGDVWRLMPAIYLTLDLSQIACFTSVRWARLAETIQMEASLASGEASSSSASSSAHSSLTSSSGLPVAPSDSDTPTISSTAAAPRPDLDVRVRACA